MKSRAKIFNNIFSLLALLASLLGSAWTATPAQAASTKFDIIGPAGSGKFGDVHILPNGNFVVADEEYDAPGPIADVGAVYLYNGATHALISTLTGSTANDKVGDYVIVLENGNFVVVSSTWNGNRGAVTWGSGTTGVSGVVSAANSLVGSTAGDKVGDFGIYTLTNGNYVVVSPNWDGEKGAATWGNGTTGIVGAVSTLNSLVGSNATDYVGNSVRVLENGNYVVISRDWDGTKGAATWGNGTTGIVGAVSAANSLVGSSAGDQVGYDGAAELTNGSYVVISPYWNGNRGAATWGNGTTGIVGAVSAANSLVGSNVSDQVGYDGAAELTNGNYVVSSSTWDGTKGAVTWGNGTTGIVGAVSAANSLVGSNVSDQVGYDGVAELTNGNYLVASSSWNGNRGAVTWGSGTTGIVGAVSAANSLVGSSTTDFVGNDGIEVLTNGNYVVGSPNWDGGKGAATLGNGTTGIVGTISAANSLVGSTATDFVGRGGIEALTNGNYVVVSYNWDGGKGAATLGNGTTGIVGTISAANSLVGSSVTDNVGNDGAAALTNGNYVVVSSTWDGTKGAVTWGNGTTGIVGVVTTINSLVGSSAGDQVGYYGIEALTDGNYVVNSPTWNGNRGAVTWGNGTTGISGEVVSAANSLVGSTVDDQVGYYGINTLTNGSYVVTSPYWDSAQTDSGAITLVSSAAPVTGVINSNNSVLGTAANFGYFMYSEYDYVNDQLIVARPADNIVTIFSVLPPTATFSDVPLTYWASSYIERLYSAGITGGCSTVPLNYCPDATVTRAQMAIFLLKGIHGSSYTPPAVGVSTGFGDVATDYWAAAWIKQLAAEGITSGCGGGNYCPDNTVTRAQMAIFLLKAKNGSGYTPPAVGVSTGFNDVATDAFAAAFIKQLVADGITAGCGNSNYCPNDSVTRAQMAVFLVRAFNLP
ncbi:MAG: S-layer homology domain-containing protein [Anaerolineales bacterium]|nr:S-layer homology domain-containing protein [Anaerolineales bacterium]